MNFLDCVKINPTIHFEKGKIYPFVEMAHVGSNSREPLFIEEKIYESGVKFEKGDSIVARITPCLQNGKRFYCKNIACGFGSTEFLVFRPKNNFIENRYLYYLLQTDYIKEKMIKSMVGATGRQRVNNDVFAQLKVDLPNYEIQIKIANVLSAYDDLIENNQKQIKLLEEAAQRLYKEWFVDLHFPGYESTPIVDGVPQGWDIRTLDTFGEIITGKTPSTANKSYYDGNIPFVKIPDMHDTIYPIVTESKLSEEGANTQKNKFIPKDSIMVSCIATVGLVNIAVQECQTNQQINSIILNDVRDLYYLYFSTKGLKMLLDGVGSNGATMTNVNKSKFANIEILYPTIELCGQFYDFCKPIFEKILILSKSIIEQKNIRDKLLPKLMSGELEV